MTRTTITGAVLVIVVVLLALILVFRNRALERNVADRTTAPAIALPTTAPGADVHSGFIYGRVITGDGTTHEGRLRWGGDQEAFWGDYFNGTKKENPCARPEYVPWTDVAQVDLDRPPSQR